MPPAATPSAEPFDPLATVHKRIDELSADLSSNTKATEANTASIGRLEGSVGNIEKNTNDIVEFFQAGKGAFKFLGWLGKIAKWVGAIAAMVAALYAAITAVKTGISPGDFTPPK